MTFSILYQYFNKYEIDFQGYIISNLFMFLSGYCYHQFQRDFVHSYHDIVIADETQYHLTLALFFSSFHSVFYGIVDYGDC